MNVHPLVSIITPSFNQADYIEDTILSIVNQDYKYIEHIIVDGGSDDGSIEIIKRYAERNPNMLKWISEDDRGQADAINKGFNMAEGQVVAWLNSDDVYVFRSAISEVAEVFNNNPEVDIVYGDAVLIDSNNRLLRIMSAPNFDYSWLLRGFRITQPAMFFRKKVVNNDKLDADIDVVFDYEYILRIGKKHQIMHVPKIWAGDRNHPKRKIISMREKMKKQDKNIQRKYNEKWNDNQLVCFWGNFMDRIVLGVPGRIFGLFHLFRLYNVKSNSFAIKLTLDALVPSIYRQLCKKNRNLV